MKFSMCFRSVLFVLAATLLATNAGATRHALLVGLNNYSPAYGPSSLNGCVNDVNGILEHAMMGDEAGRWSTNTMQVLFNSDGTKAAIRGGLQDLAATASPGDLVVYFQSSHGGQVSGTSTYLCAYDASYMDTELGQDLALFDSSVNVIVVIDACHSGGMFKGRDWPFIENVMASFRETKARALAEAGQPVPKEFGANIGFMVAADYDESSWEDNSSGEVYGLYSYALIRACGLATADVNDDGELQFMEMYNYAASRTAASQTAQHLNETLLGATVVRTAGYDVEIDDVYEENDTQETAYDLSDSNGIWLSDLDGPGFQWDPDWYKIHVPAGAERIRVDCRFTHADGDIDIALVDASGSAVAESYGTSNQEYIDYVVPPGFWGDYYILVHYGNAGNAYDLMWNYVDDDSYEPNDVRLSAHDLSAMEQVWLSTLDGPGRQYDYDWYQVRVSDGSSRLEVDCRFVHADGNIDLALYNAAGQSVAFASTYNDDEFIDYALPSPAAADYYIRVSGDNLGNTYDLRWNDIPTVPMADLVVTSISHAPATVYPGDAVTFTAVIRNQGSAETSDLFRVAFWADRISAPLINTLAEQEKDIFHALTTNETATVTFQVSAPAAGTHTAWAFVDNYLGVGEVVESDENNNAGPLGGYVWEVEPPPPADDAYEANDTLETAFDLSGSPETWLSDLEGVGIQFDDDWYAIVVPAGSERVQVDCRFTHAGGNIDLALFDSSGTQLAASAEATDNAFIETIVPAAGTYLIAVTGAHAGNTYDLWWGVFSKLTPVHRFWSDQMGSHFYIMGDSERDRIADKYPGIWNYEAVAWYAYPTQEPGTEPVHRFWSDVLGKHFYIMGDSERDRIIDTYPGIWNYETISWYAYPTQEPGTDPVGRFWSDQFMGHFYTITKTEINRIIDKYPGIWDYETVAYWAFTTPSPVLSGTVAVMAKPDAGKGVDPAETRVIVSASADTVSGLDMIYPFTFAEGPVSAQVWDSDTERWTSVLDETAAPAVAVLENVDPDQNTLLEVCVNDAADGMQESLQRIWLDCRRDPPADLSATEASRDARAPNGIGTPLARVTLPAMDGPLTVRLYSSTEGVVQTLTDVPGGETVELPLPLWDNWYWIGGWRDADDARVLSIWIRQALEE